jgi:Peptidase family M49.
MRLLGPILFLFAAPALVAADNASQPDANRLREMHARFVPVEISADISHLPDHERTALARMIDAAKILDAIFLRQVAPLNETHLAQLVRDPSPLGRARLAYFRLNAGPWSRLDENAPFLPHVGPKPPGANFYPADATRDEIDAWLNALPPAEHAHATGFFTVIRRTPERAFVAVPYSLEYHNELVHAARLLREAAAATTQPTLKNFLEKRAAAFLDNDYYASDVAWMELDASIEPTIGPYEVYEDEWFNYKAAFEAFITITDRAETAKLARFSEHLQTLEDNLPIDPQFRRAQLGGYSPIRVVNLVFSSGDANRGVQTAAFNLPNDERVVAEKGSKRVMLKNIQQAKFDHVLVPISKRALAPIDQPFVAFDPFFTHILMHELMHGLGPQTIQVDGRETSVRAELKELGGRLEEAKADISGLWALQFLMDAGVIDQSQERAMYTTFLASTFRTLRFGLESAHARGMALQLNWLLDGGAFVVNSDGTFGINFEKLKPAVTSLTREILMIQAKGDYAAAKSLLDRMVVIRPEVKRVLDNLKDVPVDIEPHFTTAQSL